jgi:hypothetical protein
MRQRQPFGDRGLADPGLADQQRVVLAPAAERLDDPFEFLLAPDQRIDLALQRQRVEVDRVALERPAAATGFCCSAFRLDSGSVASRASAEPC